MAYCTVLAEGVAWPVATPKGKKKPGKVAKGASKVKRIVEYLNLNPGSYAIQVSMALREDYLATQRTLHRLALSGKARCVESAYYPA